ncbi:TonB-dependent receptor plug domain-containing protein [Niastella sp. OAS944]|uniref:TonB-dependent receptor plug domain-containing protein n=1 Tax=Niastella sp. OAS944 TaxID=2664089 RepID=UPI0034854D24|nr:TonB-linked SusC/RagA family outer membrane protein [Chitinophagaceae bacterium OAS944]
MRVRYILGVLFMHFFITGISQPIITENENRRITLSFENVPLYKIVKELKCAFYAPAELMDIPVSIHVKDTKLQDVLDLLSARLPVRFSYADDMLSMQWKLLNVTGVVVDVNGDPLPEVMVSNLRNRESVYTGSKGQFELQRVCPLDTLLVTHLNYGSKKYLIGDHSTIIIELSKVVNELPPVVVVHTGYQEIPQENVTGSYMVLRTPPFVAAQVPTFNVQESFKYGFSGYLPALQTNPGTIVNMGSIRGRSTIYSNAQPLVVLDDFPFYGDLYMLNPNDIESITIAKDASATAIYGTRAANGVFIIKTNKASKNQPLEFSVNSFLTYSHRPDVNYMPAVQAKDYVLLEENMFEDHVYRAIERFNLNVPVTPVIETLIKYKKGYFTAEQKDAILNDFKSNDIRKDIKKYFYRPAFTNQNAVSVSGSCDSFTYYGSMSYGRSFYNEKGNEHRRITVQGNMQYRNKAFSYSTSVSYSGNRILDNFVSPPDGPSYLRLADADGRPLPVPYQFRSTYIDTVGNGNLHDWRMRPLQELRLANNVSRNQYLMTNAKAGYKIFPALQLQTLYQFSQLKLDHEIEHNASSYYVRNLRNQFAQVTPSGIVMPIPAGAILDEYKSNTNVNNLRVQLNYNPRWKNNEFTIIGGTESQRLNSRINTSRFYGYNLPYTQTPIDFKTYFPQYTNPATRNQVPAAAGRKDSVDYYVSYFGNAFYNWSKKITVSFSFRRDKSNQFGSNTNRHFIPLWAAGALVHLHEFSFYPEEFPYLRLRGSIGKTGNGSLQTPWSATISMVNDPASDLPIAYINNPGNANLQFEEMRMLNIGIDIVNHHHLIKVSIDAYRKRGNKLLDYFNADPTSGMGLIKSNTGRLSGFGIDVNIYTINLRSGNISTSNKIKRGFEWETKGWMSYTTNKVQSRELLLNEAWQYVNPATYIPRKGYPVDAIFAFPMRGLDGWGDPIGYIDNMASEDYLRIITSPDPRSLKYIGPGTPNFFCSITNTLRYRDLMLSFQITGKFKYYFRRTSLNAFDLLNGASIHGDFYKRWKTPGDERITTVPALKPYFDANREFFYQYSETLIERGDHIRLQYLQLMYNWRSQKSRQNNTRLQLGITLSNVGILWSANKKQLDPDVVTGMLPDPLNVSLSVTAHF